MPRSKKIFTSLWLRRNINNTSNNNEKKRKKKLKNKKEEKKKDKSINIKNITISDVDTTAVDIGVFSISVEFWWDGFAAWSVYWENYWVSGTTMSHANLLE